ncbi:helix-turn-helix transcriptional regulator [Novosphingobium profundi]|uniref:helix-turn-helix domain-containing protein n=1 Tax=Novosphingobium profundi TaxID=1774954 RepID=UPI001BDB699E|nr:helix-turn-helix transcriptional regulator [Novosphingobium profundi]MBT0667010.1 helix-turn-helix transcriptional regulator [Novosphingobium profundi]
MQYLLRMNPSNRVRELRKKAGLSQLQLANLAGISQPAVSQIENDTRPLTIDWMRTIARIIGCTPADLLSSEDNPDRLDDTERSLVDDYRHATEPQREMVRRVAAPIPDHAQRNSDAA